MTDGSDVPAIRNGHIYEIKSSYILQPGPAALTEGVRQLHHIIARVAQAIGAARSGAEEHGGLHRRNHADGPGALEQHFDCPPSLTSKID